METIPWVHAGQSLYCETEIFCRSSLHLLPYCKRLCGHLNLDGLISKSKLNGYSLVCNDEAIRAFIIMLKLWMSAWKKQRRTCMLLALPRTRDSNAQYLKKRLKNSRVSECQSVINFNNFDLKKLSTKLSTCLPSYFVGLPGVLWVLPDSYIDVKNKDYGGDSFNFPLYIYI